MSPRFDWWAYSVLSSAEAPASEANERMIKRSPRWKSVHCSIRRSAEEAQRK
jgi:hypothetical protein